MKNEAFQMWAAMSTTIATSGVLAWGALSYAITSRNRSAPPGRGISAAALLVGPIFAMLELRAVALSFRSVQPWLPWIIAAGGVLALGTIVPFMAANTRRLPPGLRRRSLRNIAVIIVFCTLMAELFVFAEPSWQSWILAAASLIAVIGAALQKRRSGSGG